MGVTVEFLAVVYGAGVAAGVLTGICYAEMHPASPRRGGDAPAWVLLIVLALLWFAAPIALPWLRRLLTAGWPGRRAGRRIRARVVAWLVRRLTGGQPGPDRAAVTLVNADPVRAVDIAAGEDPFVLVPPLVELVPTRPVPVAMRRR